jgi:hypothetical protein
MRSLHFIPPIVRGEEEKTAEEKRGREIGEANPKPEERRNSRRGAPAAAPLRRHPLQASTLFCLLVLRWPRGQLAFITFQRAVVLNPVGPQITQWGPKEASLPFLSCRERNGHRVYFLFKGNIFLSLILFLIILNNNFFLL